MGDSHPPQGLCRAKITLEGPNPFFKTVVQFRSLEANAFWLVYSFMQQTRTASPVAQPRARLCTWGFQSSV